MKLSKDEIVALSNKVESCVRQSIKPKPISKSDMDAINDYYDKLCIIHKQEEHLVKAKEVIRAKFISALGIDYSWLSKLECVKRLKYNRVDYTKIKDEVVLSLAFSKDEDLDTFVNKIAKKFL